ATIDQSFATEPGQDYIFSGWISHNPSIAEGRADVYLNDQHFVQLFHSNALYGETTNSNMRWQPFSYRFPATGSTTNLKLSDITNLWDGGGGAVLDGLSVTPVSG